MPAIARPSTSHYYYMYYQGRILGGGALGARAPRGHQRGAKKKEKRKGKERGRGENRKKEEKKGIRKKKGRKREQERKKKERRLNQYNERGAMQFQVQAGAPGKKTSGALNWRRIRREGRHAVSSASRGSREENVRGAKMTERRTRGAPCSVKYKQGLQWRKRQGRQIDGEKDERGAMQFQVQAGAPGKKTSGALNWRRIRREGRHAVSSASRGSREENVRGAKLTEKRTRGAPCSFKCKQGLQGRKRQGR